MADLAGSIDALAASAGFSGVVRVDVGGETVVAKAYGLAHRALGVPNTLDTQFGLASGSKGVTALTVVRLVEQGVLALDTPARTLLGDDLPLIGDDVTVESLLAHRSGIGDYLDESDDYDVADYVLAVPVHELATTEDFLRVLDGHPAQAPAGTTFAYNNGGFVVLALLAERATGTPFHDLADELVCRPAGMVGAAFLRSDELPGPAALGYLAQDGDRTNVLHLPVRGNGDGGMYATVADVHALWDAFMGGRIVAPSWVDEMVKPRSVAATESMRYGLGFWLDGSGPAVMLEGLDAGVSFRSVHDPSTRTTHTVVSNWTDGAWPVTRHLDTMLTDAGR